MSAICPVGLLPVPAGGKPNSPSAAIVAAAAPFTPEPLSTRTLVSLAASFLFTVPVALVLDPGGFAQVTLVALAWFAALGFFNFPGGRYTTYAAMRWLGPTRAIMIRNLTPVIAVVISVFVFDEWPSLQIAIGGLLIIAGLYVAIEDTPRRPPPAGPASSVEADTAP